MSLFKSAFDTPGSGPSKAMNFGATAPKKNKKASLNDDALRGVAVNVQKLMDQVERGEVKEKAAGKEGLGFGAAGSGRKKRRGSHASDDTPSVPKKQKQKPKPKRKSELAELTAAPAGGDPAPRLAEAPKGKKKAKKDHAPAMPAPKPKPVVQPKAKATEGMTKMQQQMASKLEGARFRWINEQLYTTKSTEAVAMMAKEPKIFEDVSESRYLARRFTSS